MRPVLLIAVASVWLAEGVALAVLQPEEVAIVAMKDSSESRSVADYYAQRRGIPKSHIYLMDGAIGGVLKRQEWETSQRPAIRRWLMETGLVDKVRCLVTVWDVPLKIDRYPKDSPPLQQRLRYLGAERRARIGRLNELLRRGKEEAGPGNGAAESPLDADAGLDAIRAKLAAAFEAANERAAAGKETPQAASLAAHVQRLVVASGGLAALVRQAAAQKSQDESQQKKAQLLRGRILGIQEGLRSLQNLVGTVERDQQILSLLETSSGIVGTLQWIDAQVDVLNKNETYASFDSELSLVLWPDYPKDRWQLNALYYQMDGSYSRWLKKTLMVSRLEAPTLALTRQMIDTAIEVEQRGLSGKVYLDARGIATNRKAFLPGSYASYDHAIRELNRLLTQHTKLEVRLDNKPPLFQAGDCPEAAIYCGWYSLGKYVDAFEWVPGAVGYHIASSEAQTLRNPRSKVWCKRMLEEGVCATVGPVYEPYLRSFPRPDDFFALLLSGKCTLAEAYYRTKPSNSWVMVLVGDPLYNPFAKRPPIALEDLPTRLRRGL